MQSTRYVREQNNNTNNYIQTLFSYYNLLDVMRLLIVKNKNLPFNGIQFIPIR